MERINIIESGSSGNCYIYNEMIMVDVGISLKKIKSKCDLNKIKLVLISHEHSDHFNKTTIKNLAKDKPLLRFAVGSYLVNQLVELGINKRNIDVLEVGKVYDYGLFKIVPIKLFHDVSCYGYRIFLNDGYKIFHATDTCTLDRITAKNYDFYGIEANYINEEELHERAYNEFYESRVKRTHLSKEQATDWLLENMGLNSVYCWMHQHKEKRYDFEQ